MIMFSDEVFSILKLVVFLNILCKTDFIYYYYNFFFFFTASVNERESLLRPQGHRQEAALWAKKPAEGPYLTFFLGCRLLVWPHFLQQLTAGAIGDRNAANVLSQLDF